MTQRIIFQRFFIACLAVLILPLAVHAANTKKTVAKVEGTVTLTDDVDYFVTSDTPFADDGVVNIANTDHAVLILNKVKPSAAISLLAAHVQIGGQKAVNNTNCQVKLYNRGCIIMPYASSLKPLTVFSEQNFEGTAVSDFGLENDGGFMNTLTEAKLNNKIRSFKLKRGYMVTFSTLAKGRGYSRCFIAADKDLEIASLPTVLDQKITSYRVFKWYDTSKVALANDTRASSVSALNVTSCYSFGLGENRLPDAECVPHRIHEGWPSPADCGKVNYSPHLKTNNEPRNRSDDSPATLDEILANWETLMATGMRLCSPSSWDGSDYVGNAGGFLREFFDSIDARGWRCDIIDLHCYWAEGTFNSMHNWTDAVHRPIWISEWVWGASWNNNGIFGVATGSNRDNPTDAQLNENKTVLSRICSNLNSWNYVERYFYWNSEANCSKILRDGKLTPAGEMYAQLNSGLGYNGKYDYVPTNPRQYAPSDFKVQVEGESVTISWKEYNGEMNQLMQLERKLKGGQWELLEDVEQKEASASYKKTYSGNTEGTQYRLHIIDLNGTDYYTNDELEPGDAVVTADGRTLYVGGNLLVNGDFSLGDYGWTNGQFNALGQPHFEIVPIGGIDGGAYLQAYGNANMDNAASLKTLVQLQKGTDYYFRAATKNGGNYQKVSLTADGTTEAKDAVTLKNSTEWQRQGATFNSGDYQQALIAFRWLGGKAQLDKMELRRLFESQADAQADAEAVAQAQAEVIAQYQAAQEQLRQDSIAKVDAALKKTGFPLTSSDLIMSVATIQPQSPDFKSTTGWQLKAGTYKDGDQRQNTIGGKTCWNAWWANLNASEGKKKTMEVRQTVSSLPEGIYVLECKATTQHFCQSDQHGYLICGQDTVVTPTLQADYFDLPVGNIWQTLTTAPIYVKEGSDVTIGFVGSKQGAINNAWHKFGDATDKGDKREGWWCATDFRLLAMPIYQRTEAAPAWGTICLPSSFIIPQDVTLYQIAGMLPDSTAICLEEVKEPEAGIPYIYYSKVSDLLFVEYGTVVENTSKGANNLTGYFKTAVKAPVNSYVLHGDKWYVVNERPKVANNTAFIRKLDGIEVLTGWQGITMPLVHQPWEEVAGITPLLTPSATAGKAYDLGGRPIGNRRGLHISKGRKVLR